MATMEEMHKVASGLDKYKKRIFKLPRYYTGLKLASHADAQDRLRGRLTWNRMRSVGFHVRIFKRYGFLARQSFQRFL